jgi:hypothetical protein
MSDEQRSVDVQIAEAEAEAARAREQGRELEEKEALERVAVLKGLHRLAPTEGIDGQGSEDDKPSA